MATSGGAGDHGADGAGEEHEGVAHHHGDDHDDDGGAGVLGEAHDVRGEHDGAHGVGADAPGHSLAEVHGILLGNGHHARDAAGVLDRQNHGDDAEHDNEGHGHVAQIGHPLHAAHGGEGHAQAAQDGHGDNGNNGEQGIGGLADEVGVDGEPADGGDDHDGHGHVGTGLTEGVLAQQAKAQAALGGDDAHGAGENRQDYAADQHRQHGVLEVQARADVAAGLHAGDHEHVAQGYGEKAQEALPGGHWDSLIAEFVAVGRFGLNRCFGLFHNTHPFLK